MKENQLIILNKRSTVEVSKPVHNQCRDVGFRLYDYHAKIYSRPLLNRDGWIIDNTAIHSAVKAALEQSGSCEQMLLRGLDELNTLLTINKVEFLKIYLMIKPSGSDSTTSFEGIVHYKKYSHEEN